MEGLFLAILVAVYVFGAPVFLFIRLRRVERSLADTRRALTHALESVEKLRAEPDGDAAAEPRAGPEDRAVPPAPASVASADEHAAFPPADPAFEDAPRVVPAVRSTGQARGAARSVEETLTSQWMIWLGAVALALSAVFLFRYAVDQGWLTPFARVTLGLLLGGTLLSAGEWAMRHPVKAVRRAVDPDYVPPALTGSGLFAIFVSLFAAHALFGLLSGATGFAALGLVAYAALALSLRQGPFVAILGLVAGYLVPALVATPEPQALPLFLYLFVLTAGCLAVTIWRHWWWFSYLTLAGAIFWPGLWLMSDWTPGDQTALGAYALGLALLFALLSTRLPVKRPETPFVGWMIEALAETSGLGFALAGILLVALAMAAEFNAAAFAFVGLYGAAALILGYRRGTLESLPVVAAAIAFVAVLIWLEPAQIAGAAEERGFPRGAFGPFRVPTEFQVLATALCGFSALFGLGAFAGLARARTPAIWAGLSALMPLLFFVIGYWRIGALETDISWAALAAALAALAALAASVVGRAELGAHRDLSLGLYAAGCTAALALAFACVLREAWLTVALSCETLALAWIWSRLRVGELRTIAAVATAIVIVRLVGNPKVLDYDGEGLGVFGWVVYGYGIPAVATWLAARVFARTGKDAVTTLLEIAAAGLGFLMVALQLKLWSSGDIYTVHWRLFDQSIQVLWWLVAGALLLAEAARGARDWPYPAGLGLVGLAIAVAFLGCVVTLSPLFTGEAVGRLPVVNLLGLSYLAPAILAAAIGWSGRVRLVEAWRRVLAAASGLLTFVYITLETRRTFLGTHIGLTAETQPSSAELYAYSAVWIVFALCLLALGILRVSVPLRYASLAVLLVTVAKVFLFDMSDLTGLFRVASFLGLGLTLIGIGRIYQRFVFRSPGEEGR